MRTVNAINRIKRQLKSSPQIPALFVFGINTAFRAGELLSIRIGQVRNLLPGDQLEIKKSKTGRYRTVTLNRSTHAAILPRIEN